ncbi:transposase [Streptomyces sp. NPDC007205]|uniref:transposase n=1 Tax=Streptomyces sp. NPDC007205 TaxID=3154316 RepID=UPI0033C1B566
MSLPHRDTRREALEQLSCFRGEFYSCLTARPDALFELADAVLCGDGPVRSLPELSLVGEHRCGHGGLYSAVARGRIDASRLRRVLASVSLPRPSTADWSWPSTSPAGCGPMHTPHRNGSCVTPTAGAKTSTSRIPDWPYSIICALEPGRSSWTAPLDALRLQPGDDTATVTARQLRELIETLIRAAQWQEGDPKILIIADAGYNAPRLVFLLRDLPVQVLARMRSDRVLRRAVPPRQPHTQARPPRHGSEFVFGQPGTWVTPDTETVTATRLYSTARTPSRDRPHPRLTHRSSCALPDGTSRSSRQR